MIRSRISRSFIVVIFIALIIFLGYLDITCIVNSVAGGIKSKFIKIGYIFVVLSLVAIYMYIKDKLYKIKMKRSQALGIRHVFLGITFVLFNLLSINRYISDINIYFIILGLACSMASAFIIKKIIFNVSKSDLLSVLALYLYSMLPIVINKSNLYVNFVMVFFSVFSVILLLQLLIDELKQKGIKNKKYLILSIASGVIMGISTILGINIIIWAVLLISLLAITINLDNTHVNFPKKVMKSITQENREKLYGVERINISKIFICVCISLLSMLIVYFIGGFIFDKISMVTNTALVKEIVNNISDNNMIIEKIQETSFSSIALYLKSILDISKSYYIVLFSYILLVEFLNILLRRRYDTKSTMLKLFFILLCLVSSLTGFDVYIMHPLFSMMLILIAIVNTSNIYLNREERVKMLVA